MKVTVNFTQDAGKIKPLHSVCCAPYVRKNGPKQTLIHTLFREARIPYCRLHDCCGAYGGGYYVDVPNVFPDFDADENDPANYNFYHTDEYIGAIQAAGTESYYRLGTTIEWGSKKITAVPPADFAKWARVCEHIIRHYNEGWADGFHYNLKYWEIWNEPENPGDADFGKCQWTGTDAEFFDLYATASKHLKACFPHLKIGGYGGCGFYAVTRPDAHQTRKDFVTFFTDFLAMARERGCPLDFYSWHIYTGDEKELLAHARYVRETLDAYGFTETESHLNEWNIHAEGTGFLGKHTMEGASFDAAVLCMLQNSGLVDMAHYYAFHPSSYNGFQNQNDSSVIDPPWYAFVAFGNLYRLGQAAAVETAGDVYAAAAASEKEQCILLSNYTGGEDMLTVEMTGTLPGKTAEVRYITADYRLETLFSCTTGADTALQIRLPKQTVVMIHIH